jgi:hypothetical protein
MNIIAGLIPTGLGIATAAVVGVTGSKRLRPSRPDAQQRRPRFEEADGTAAGTAQPPASAPDDHDTAVFAADKEQREKEKREFLRDVLREGLDDPSPDHRAVSNFLGGIISLVTAIRLPQMPSFRRKNDESQANVIGEVRKERYDESGATGETEPYDPRLQITGEGNGGDVMSSFAAVPDAKSEAAPPAALDASADTTGTTQETATNGRNGSTVAALPVPVNEQKPAYLDVTDLNGTIVDETTTRQKIATVDEHGAFTLTPPEPTPVNLDVLAASVTSANSRFAEERAALVAMQDKQMRETVAGAPWWLRLDPEMAADDITGRKRLASTLRRIGAEWSYKLTVSGYKQDDDDGVRGRLLGALYAHKHLIDDASLEAFIRAAGARSTVEAAAALELGYGPTGE